MVQVVLWHHLVMLYMCISSVQMLLLLLLAVLMDFTVGSQSCIFDSLRPRQVPSTEVVYPLNSQSFHDQQRLRRHRRRTSEASLDELFAPIRIASFFIEMELNRNEKEELKSVVKKSLAQIESIFSG